MIGQSPQPRQSQKHVSFLIDQIELINYYKDGLQEWWATFLPLQAKKRGVILIAGHTQNSNKGTHIHPYHFFFAQRAVGCPPWITVSTCAFDDGNVYRNII